MKNLSAQVIFNRVANHLLTQNAKAMRARYHEDGERYSADICAYRADDGKKCAVGCLIPDYLYDSNIEAMSCSAGRVRDILEFSGVSTDKIKLLESLQYIHDNDEVREWPKELEKVASNNGLRKPPILKAVAK